MSESILLRRLHFFDALELAVWLRRQPPEHVRYFQPFPFTYDAVRAVLDKADRDLYLGLWVDEAFVGLVLLRGWDEGYEIPVFGTMIDHQRIRQGWGRLALVLTASIARSRGASQLMLKVHPENTGAKTLYESEGFVQTGIEEATGNLIYHRPLR